MKAVNLITTFLLLPWGGIVMMSPMMVASKGFRDSSSSILTAMVIIGYPIIIFAIHKVFGWSFWGIKANTSLLISGILIGSIYLLYGFPRMLLNLNKGIPNDGYFFKGQVVYMDGAKISDADASTFQTFKDDDRYAKDKNYVFFDGKIIESADPSSFKATEVVREEDEILSDLKPFYWADKRRVFYAGQMLENSDPKTFQYKLPFSWDADNVYYLGKRLVKSTAKNFKILKDGIAVDGTFVIVYGKYSAQKVDQETFEVVEKEDNMYCQDKNHIYVLHIQLSDPLVKVEGADLSTFSPLERSYAVDKNHVYYYGYNKDNKPELKRLQGANPASFKVGYDEKTGTEATDGIHFYLNGVEVR